jgi:hypothetical protein
VSRATAAIVRKKFNFMRLDAITLDQSVKLFRAFLIAK